MATSKDHASPTDPYLHIDEIGLHTALPETRFSRVADRFLNKVGELASWSWVVLMAIIITNVALRYLFSEGRIEFEELQWHLYAVGWLAGLSYCFVHDDHVRVDILHDRFRNRTRAWVEFLGTLFLLLPFISIVLIYTVPFILYSWELGEVSSAPGGLPYRWLIKSALLLGFAFLLLAAISRFTRIVALLFASSPKETRHGDQ